MQAKYTPTDESERSTEAFGQVFEAGKFVNVKDLDPEHQKLLAQHPQFETKGDAPETEA